MIELNTAYTGKYIGKTMCGFINGHEYCITFDKDVYGYKIKGIEDITVDENLDDAFLRLSSEISIQRYFNLNENDEAVTSE